ncbi:unnamed protein product, partial [Wuchereria bancrofti]
MTGALLFPEEEAMCSADLPGPGKGAQWTLSGTASLSLALSPSPSWEHPGGVGRPQVLCAMDPIPGRMRKVTPLNGRVREQERAQRLPEGAQDTAETVGPEDSHAGGPRQMGSILVEGNAGLPGDCKAAMAAASPSGTEALQLRPVRLHCWPWLALLGGPSAQLGHKRAWRQSSAGLEQCRKGLDLGVWRASTQAGMLRPPEPPIWQKQCPKGHVGRPFAILVLHKCPKFPLVHRGVELARVWWGGRGARNNQKPELGSARARVPAPLRPSPLELLSAQHCDDMSL